MKILILTCSFVLSIFTLSAGSLGFSSNYSSNTNTLMNDNSKFLDCNLTIKGNFDGLEIDVVVTVHDITWIECQGLKAAVKAAL